MKIIWTYRVFGDGKTHITTWRETNKFLNEKHDIYYIFPYKKRPVTFTENAELIKKISIPSISATHYVIASLLRFINLYKKVKPDLVIIDYWSFGIGVYCFLFRLKTKVIIDFRDPRYIGENAKYKNFINKIISRSIIKFNYNHQDGISFISDGLRDIFIRDFHFTHPNYCIWPSGVDLTAFDPTKFDNNPEKNDYLIFFHGSITHHRGLLEVVKAMKILQNDGCNNIFFEIIGEGPYQGVLEDYIQKNQIANIHISPSIPYTDIPEKISKSDLCVMAYPKGDFWEGNVPIKILEYMAMEKPILCTRLKIFELIAENKDFIIFIEDNDPSLIADKIKSCFTDKDQMVLKGKQGREVAKKKYTWEKISNDLNEFFNKTLNKSKNVKGNI